MTKGRKCKVSNCAKIVTQNDTALCSMHKGRWTKYKSYDLPPKHILPHGIVKICPIHGNLMPSDIRVKDKKRIRKDGEPTICKMCKHCDNINAKAWRAKSGYKPKYKPGRHRKRTYGISPDEYQRMYDLREGKCDMCGKLEIKILHGKLMDLCIDHNHETGEVRGLLCFRCNVAYGLIDEDINIMRKMIEYKKARG